MFVRSEEFPTKTGSVKPPKIKVSAVATCKIVVVDVVTGALLNIEMYANGTPICSLMASVIAVSRAELLIKY